MIAEKYKRLRAERIPENLEVPDTFFHADEFENPFSVCMISCLGAERFLYLDDNFYELTGYTNEEFKKGGMEPARDNTGAQFHGTRKRSIQSILALTLHRKKI